MRLQLFILAYNLGNFLRRLGLPKAVKDWSLRSIQAKLIKIGGRIVRHARKVVFQLAREVFVTILERVSRLCFAPGQGCHQDNKRGGVINGEVSALTRFRGFGWSSGTKILGAAGSDAADSKRRWAPWWLDYRSKGSYTPGSRSGKG